ncbi:hypothetical protein LCGC14_1087630 [marine sediment metagenome]|uniref:Glycosyl transferase family 1 domain-containing protein n=1 Tax=marine sediment metagenome TaxID=412755 RepID=A0A0F9MHS0_9ZZZZ
MKDKNENICIISQYYPPDNASDSVRLIKVIKSLKSNGFKITVVTAFPHYPDGKIPTKYKKKFLVREKWDDVDVIRTYVPPLPHNGLLKRFLIHISFTFSALIALFYLEKIKIIYAFSQKFFSYITGILYKLVLRAPLILDVVDIWPEAIVNAGIIKKNKKTLLKIIRFPLKIFYNMSDKLITLTEAMKELLVTTAHLKSSKISILPIVTYPDKFKPTKLKKRAHNNKFNIIYSGNLGVIYDFQNLLKTAFNLKNYKDIQFIIKGTGDERIKSFLHQYIKINKLKNVHFNEEFLNSQEFIKFLNLADAFVLPMKKCPFPDASFPSKLIDYLTFGKPVIYSGEGYIANLINDLELGIITIPGSPQDLSKAILYLKKNEEIKNKMGENARKAVKQLFSPQILDQKVKEIFKNLIYKIN